MKLAERPHPYSSIPNENTYIAEIMAPPPIFDISKAEKAVRLVEHMGQDGFQAFPALKLALTLSLYNYSVSEQPTKKEMSTFLGRFKKLTDEEKQASDEQDPRPTIGWEVEVQGTSLSMLKTTYNEDFLYKDLFEAIGMFNYGNTITNNPSAIEFSPYPSYTASVSARTLCELIKGGFIPSLRESKDPAAIREYLGGKLVSLHVNLGIPLHTDKEPVIPNFVYGEGNSFHDVGIFTLGFALAFTSKERLRNKYTEQLAMIKRGAGEMTETTKSNEQKGRVEVKALEVRDQSVYRLLHEMQVWGAAFFSSYSEQYPKLSEKWGEMKQDLLFLYDETKATPSLFYNKAAIADFAQHATVPAHVLAGIGVPPALLTADTNLPIGTALRLFITKEAHEITEIIERNQ